MTRFLITMNMPSRSGGLIHQVICEHPARTVKELSDAMEGRDFLTVEEFYRDTTHGGYFSSGEVALNVMHIGKIKVDKSK
jgi:hypothetical protein